MKKLVAALLVAGALLVNLSPAFAYTSATPALPDPNMAETPWGVFSDLWFALGVSAGGE